MKAVGDSHRQQALFGEEAEFVETKKRANKSRKPKRKKPEDGIESSPEEKSKVANAKEPKASEAIAEPEFKAQQILQEESDWDEVQVSLAENPQLDESEETLSEVLRPAQKQHWWLKLTAVVVLLLLTIEGVSLANRVWQEQSWLTALYGALFALVVGGILFIVLKELRKLSLLARTEQKQQATAQIVKGEPCDNIERYCKTLLPARLSPELKEATEQWQELLDDSHTDQDVLRLYEQMVLPVCDEKAKAVIQQWSGQAALMVAISPLAALDMLLIAWRNIRMIDEIASCYGLELGFLSRLKLLKLVVYNLIYAGASELALDLGLQSVGADLAGKFSARAAQGLGAGLLSARLGIKAMQLCRPIAFGENQTQPKLSYMAKGLRQTLLSQVFSKQPG